MMSNNILKIFLNDFPTSHFVRVGGNRNLSLYIGRDDNARYSFDFCGSFLPTKISSSEVIHVEQFKNDSNCTLRFSLEKKELLEYFCTFCQDLLNSVLVVKDDETAYRTLRSRFFSWRHLFRPNSETLSEPEVMGLIGELLFFHKQLIPLYGIDKALESWMGPEKTHKDFSAKNEWYEVKTISYGKESVRISSIEQLDSEIDGYLILYVLEKMSPNFDGIRLHTLVNHIIDELETSEQIDIFIAKLELYGFNFSDKNDSFVYALRDSNLYIVEQDNFPRVRRIMIPNAIIRMQYDLLITEIEPFKKDFALWK